MRNQHNTILNDSAYGAPHLGSLNLWVLCIVMY